MTDAEKREWRECNRLIGRLNAMHEAAMKCVSGMTDAERIAELERQMQCIIKFFSQCEHYLSPSLHRDLTTPPPKPRPKIEVVPNPRGWGFVVACGGKTWSVIEDEWTLGGSTGLSVFNARAIAAALEAAGNYPKEER